ncbi:hypothetical protein [Saccharopolyspora sp. ASAGF58]|uniref:hypothetical protein n=1 Tax=Saccharopolyspora sp. ASAGF58 TaxID=2719023 RepID=UPI00144022E1|nr:hypothetical protein [Saccharopolyspora sp. ASAGF58]QIZ35963.1 hypothetical protein FDZ84_16265 [Saccharopolyspora sp. ASAGF58]
MHTGDPRQRGLDVADWAVFGGRDAFGCALHLVDDCFGSPEESAGGGPFRFCRFELFFLYHDGQPVRGEDQERGAGNVRDVVAE